MTKKKWALLLLLISLLFSWYKLFYTSYNERFVPASADCIIAIDVKRIVRTAIWQVITTPSRWDFSSSSSADDPPAIDDMIVVPDYAFIFHVSNHPDAAWYTLMEINNEADFNKGLKYYHFKQQGNIYSADAWGITFIRKGNHLVVGNLAVRDMQYIEQVAGDLLDQKKLIAKKTLSVNVGAGSHLSAQFLSNSWLKRSQLVKADYTKDAIVINTNIQPVAGSNTINTRFNYADSSLFTLAFIQPGSQPQTVLPKLLMDKLGTALNVNLDSLLAPTHKQYQLDVSAIHNRIDSAISYNYDENFNQVQTVVANEVQEPSFCFNVISNDANALYGYFKRNRKLEPTASGAWFTPIPFAKAYCRVLNSQELRIETPSYTALKTAAAVDAMLYCRLLLTKIPESLLKYLPDGGSKLLSNIEFVELSAVAKNNMIEVMLRLQKKKNDLPVIAW